MNLRKLLVLVFLAVVVCVMSAGVGAAAVIIVDDDGGAMYTSIQAAIDAASPGDEIHVDSGTYYENVVVNKQLILCGIDTGAGMPLVDAGGSGSAITLSADGITLNGFTATNAGKDQYAGIKVISSNNTLSGNTASKNYYDGIWLESSSNNNTLSGNTFSNNSNFGIFLSYSNNYYNGIWLKSSGYNNTFIGNTASNNYYGIFMRYSSNNMFIGNSVSNNKGTGIYLSFSSNNNTLSNNTASNNSDYGISLYSSCNNNTLSGNTASNNTNPRYDWRGEGIALYSSSNNMLSGNTASNNSASGIWMSSSSNNMLSNNTASNNFQGIWLYYSSNNTLSGNTASNNSYYGILLSTSHLSSSSSDNILYSNNFVDNTKYNAIEYNGNNQWDRNNSGNYYSDYTGIDSNGDGIGDTPYPIPGDGSSVDRYPLMAPYSTIPPPTVPHDKSLLQVEGQPEVYWFQNSKLYWVTDWDVISQMSGVPGWDSVNILPASEFNPGDYEQGPRFITTGAESDGLLIREQGFPEVYLILGGEKHHFASPDALLENGYSFDDVIDVNPIISSMFEPGSDIGLFSVQITSPNNGDIFSQSEEITYRAEVSEGIPEFKYIWIIDGNSNVHIEQKSERISEWSFPIYLMDIGDHTVKLEVTDSLGNVAESESITYFTSDYDLKVKSISIHQPVLIVDGEISIDIVVENVGQQEINYVNHDLYIRMIAGNKFGNYNILQEEKFSGQLDIQAGNTQTISKTFIMHNDENHELMFMVDAVEVEIISNEYQESNILNNRLIKDNILTFISMDDQTNCIFSAVIELISVNGVSLSDMYTFLESDPELKDSMGSLQFAAINEPIDALDMYAKFIIRLINLISIENSPEFVYNFVKNTIVGLFELGKCGGYSMIQMTNIVYQIQDGITTNINDYIFRVESPVDIEIINANSQSTGYVNGNIVTDIGDSYVIVDGSIKTVVIFDDADTNYMIKLTGTGDGSFNFYISSPKDDILREYKNIPVNVNSIGVLETENYILNMDFDGDGNIDQTILPTYVSVSGEKLYNITFLPPITTMDQFDLKDGNTLPIKFTARNSTTDEFIFDDTVNVTITNSTGHLITYFTNGTGTDSVRINSTEEQYIVNFHTKDYDLNVGETYAITVTFGEPDSLRGYDIIYFTLMEGGRAKGKSN